MSSVIRADGTVLEIPDQEEVTNMTTGGLPDWTEARVHMLAEDGGTLPFLRGYADYASGKTADYTRIAGLPFEASDYYEGYELASYELGNITTEEKVVA